MDKSLKLGLLTLCALPVFLVFTFLYIGRQVAVHRSQEPVSEESRIQPGRITSKSVWVDLDNIATHPDVVAGHREDEDDKYTVIGPETERAYESVHVGMSEMDVRQQLGKPIYGGGGVMDYAYRDGWVSIACLPKVISISANGIIKEGAAYPPVQWEQAQRTGKPILQPEDYPSTQRMEPSPQRSPVKARVTLAMVKQLYLGMSMAQMEDILGPYSTNDGLNNGHPYIYYPVDNGGTCVLEFYLGSLCFVSCSDRTTYEIYEIHNAHAMR